MAADDFLILNGSASLNRAFISAVDGKAAIATISSRMKSLRLFPAKAERALRVRWTDSGTFRIWIMTAIFPTSLHVQHMPACWLISVAGCASAPGAALTATAVGSPGPNAPFDLDLAWNFGGLGDGPWLAVVDAGSTSEPTASGSMLGLIARSEDLALFANGFE